MASSDKWFPEGYSPNISTERWLELLADKEVTKEESLIVLKCLKDFGGEATCKQLASKYGRHVQFYNLASSRLAKRVAQKTGCPVLTRDNANSKWWPVLYLGRYAEDSQNGIYIWKLRPELSAALNQYDFSSISLYEHTEKKDEYQLAADMLMAIAEEQGIDTDAIAQEAEQQRLAFVDRFAPEKLLAIPDDQLLREMYLTQPTTKDYMMYHLEAKTESWGSIWGGSSHKFGLFQREKDGQWINASEQVLTEEQALVYAKDIRDRLVRGARFIADTEISSREDAEKLDELLQELFGREYPRIWLHKYFALLFPNKFSSVHSEELQQHVLYCCGIIPSQKRYARSAQIAMIANQAEGQCPEVFSGVIPRFGNKLKRFYRLGSAISGQSNAEQWQKENMVVIGWSKVGPLNISDAKPDKNSLMEKLQEEYYPQDKKTASKKAGELLNFYGADADSIFVVMEGEKPLALVDEVGEYFFHPDPQTPHCRHGKWHHCFDEKDRLPYQIEGKLTSCVELKQQENLRYLYQKYYDIELGNNTLPMNDFLVSDMEERAEMTSEDKKLIFHLKQYILQNLDENGQVTADLEKAAQAGLPFRVRGDIYVNVTAFAQHLQECKKLSSISSTRVAKIFLKFKMSKRVIWYYTTGSHSRKPITGYMLPNFIERGLAAPTEKWHGDKAYPHSSIESAIISTDLSINGPSFQLHFPSPFDKNRIIFGAPGTGKSYKLKKEAEEVFGDNIERVTFHPDYAYSHFMGCYKPQTTPEGNVRYGFVPGPFLRVLVKALRSGMEGEAEPHLLLIEEINRARVAAVFGDAFQLLDRVDDEFSEYDIAVSEDVKAYLCEELGCTPDECERIRIPGNMFIWATMNSADQGVFPMDTAFKRRWTFEYLPIDPKDAPDVLIPMKMHGETRDISWNALRGAINDRLSAMRINEDKLIGPYFLKPSILEGDENGRIKNLGVFNKSFKNKILMYLFEDAARQRRQELFKGCTDCHRYSSLCEEFDKIGLDIFGDDLIKQA